MPKAGTSARFRSFLKEINKINNKKLKKIQKQKSFCTLINLKKIHHCLHFLKTNNPPIKKFLLLIMLSVVII